MPQPQSSQHPFFDPNGREATIANIINRLDEKDKEYDSLHGQLMTNKELLDKVYEQTLKTNGRVTSHDAAITALNSLNSRVSEDVASIKAWLKGLISVGSALMLLLGIIGWLLSNDYLSIHVPASRVQILNPTKP